MVKNEFSENETSSVQSATEFNVKQNEFNPTEGEPTSSTSSSKYEISKISLMNPTKLFLASFLVVGTLSLTYGCSSKEDDSSSEQSVSSLKRDTDSKNVVSLFEIDWEKDLINIKETAILQMEAKI